MKPARIQSLIGFMAALSAVSLLPAAASRAQSTYGLPRTNQTAIFHESGPNDLGDDGATHAGYPLSGARSLSFIDNGNGTVTDLATGLMWQKSDSATKAAGGLSGALNWDQAFQYAAALNVSQFGGYHDWRVPNLKELVSICNKETWLPAAYYIFDKMQNQPYWSGTAVNPSQNLSPCLVRFSESFIETQPPENTAFVKVVRSYYTGGGETGFPKTGQTAIYHPANGYDLGDDGVIQAGYPRTGESFTDLANGTVKQNATGLVWQKGDSQSQSFGEQSGPLDWKTAFAYVREMNLAGFAGYKDWRIPNYFELAALSHYGYFYPTIDPLFYNSTQRDWYWSGTTRFGDNSFALAFNFANGNGVTWDKTNACYVRAVRGGPYSPPPPTPLFPTPTPNPASLRGLPPTGQTQIVHPAGENDWGDDGVTQVGYPLSGSRFGAGTQTVTDNGTGLMWQKAESSSQSAGGLSGKLTWDQAFQYVAGLNSQNYAGYHDWRMPNTKEIASILDLGKWGPAIDGSFTGTQVDAGYWGSTTYADLVNGRYGMLITFNEGIMERPNMESTPSPKGYVRAVRSVFTPQGDQGFPRSGQTLILHYPSGGDLGDDGAIQAGYPARGQRFLDRGNGTVLDKATGLIWSKADSAHLQIGIYRGRFSWEDAFNYVREMNIRHVSGYSRWRLPNHHELMSFIDYSQFNPAIDPLFRPSVSIDLHWTSTSRFQNGDYHWANNLTCGGNAFYFHTEAAYVIAVLGGPGQSPGPTVTTPTPTPPGYFTPWPTPVHSPPFPTPTPPEYAHLYYGIPKTGQTTVYHSAGGDDPGDDGVTRAGYPVATPRWEDLGNGVLIDWATGLMWQQATSNDLSFGGKSGTMKWDDAFAYVTGMNQVRFGGFPDWRLPNCLELLSTRNLEYDFTPWSVFLGTTNDLFWSSTVSADFSSSTTVFAMGYGPGYLHRKSSDGSDLGMVRACRSFYAGVSPRGFPRTGQNVAIHPASAYDLGDDGANRAGYPVYGDRFVNQGTEAVIDNATGLMWQMACSPNGMTWADGFEYVEDLNQSHLGGYDDWRLPNQMELFSLVDYGRYNPANNPCFPNTPAKEFWSSNTHKAASTNAWAVSFLDGGADIFPKASNLFYARAVRGNVITGPRPTPTPPAIAVASGDYDGDGLSDLGIFRPENGLWVIRYLTRFYFGKQGDIPVSGDYDGDAVAEPGIFRSSNGFWAIRGLTSFYFGSQGDLPDPGDYSGDGTARAAVFRRNCGLWSVRGFTRFYFGSVVDLPVPGDYDGDGRTDLALFRSLNGLWAVPDLTRCYFGAPGVIAIDMDADGNGTTEMGIFNPGQGLWAIRGYTRKYFGTAGDFAVPANYTENEVDDFAIFRRATGLWSVSGFTRCYFGTSADFPVTR